MKKYIVTYTYQVPIEAKSEDEALNKADDLFDEEISNGNKPFDIDIIEKKSIFEKFEEVANQ